MFYQKHVPFNEKIEKAEDVYDYSDETDVELEGFDNSGQNVRYGVDFSICKKN